MARIWITDGSLIPFDAILDEGLGAMPRLPISITTFGPDATIVGQGVLRWERPGSDEASVAGPAV